MLGVKIIYCNLISCSDTLERVEPSPLVLELGVGFAGVADIAEWLGRIDSSASEANGVNSIFVCVVAVAISDHGTGRKINGCPGTFAFSQPVPEPDVLLPITFCHWFSLGQWLADRIYVLLRFVKLLVGRGGEPWTGSGSRRFARRDGADEGAAVATRARQDSQLLLLP